MVKDAVSATLHSDELLYDSIESFKKAFNEVSVFVAFVKWRLDGAESLKKILIDDKELPVRANNEGRHVVVHSAGNQSFMHLMKRPKQIVDMVISMWLEASLVIPYTELGSLEQKRVRKFLQVMQGKPIVFDPIENEFGATELYKRFQEVYSRELAAVLQDVTAADAGVVILKDIAPRVTPMRCIGETMSAFLAVAALITYVDSSDISIAGVLELPPSCFYQIAYKAIMAGSTSEIFDINLKTFVSGMSVDTEFLRIYASAAATRPEHYPKTGANWDNPTKRKADRAEVEELEDEETLETKRTKKTTATPTKDRSPKPPKQRIIEKCTWCLAIKRDKPLGHNVQYCYQLLDAFEKPTHPKHAESQPFAVEIRKTIPSWPDGFRRGDYSIRRN